MHKKRRKKEDFICMIKNNVNKVLTMRQIVGIVLQIKKPCDRKTYKNSPKMNSFSKKYRFDKHKKLCFNTKHETLETFSLNVVFLY